MHNYKLILILPCLLSFVGIQLRKVEERRVKEAQKHQPVGGLDVQSIMEAAFEMRRKALEANDYSDEEEEIDDDGVAWDSDEDR